MNERVNPSVARPVVTQRAGVTVRRVGINLGAEIPGADLRTKLSDAQFAAIEAALMEIELTKFRNDFRAEPPMATILCAKEVPAVGGNRPH